MGLIEFDKLPINTLVGAKWDTFRTITKGQTIDKGYKGKYILTKSVCRLLSLLQPFEDARYEKLIKKPANYTDPLFILGHWRSGTTFVHNVFALDKHFGYNTTYQTVFPNLMLFGQPFFKKQMSFLMPDKRPTDNMELKVDLPQEEEFALANMTPYSFYNFWFLPKNTMEYMDKYLLFETISPEELKIFKDAFVRLVNTSLWNTKGSQFLSKNPPHTARIPQLLELYPNAKFIYLVRNPYTVFESTRSFFTNTIKPLKLQDISPEQIEKNILEIYKKLFFKYEKDKTLIPEGNLVEIKFEDFESNALEKTQEIYKSLRLDGYEESRKAIENYLDKKKGYKKNKYKYDDRTRSLVEDNWSFALEKWGYSY
ncbi:MAG: sulfotransferase [Bacteroidales bacterium]|nr:sulfotransferase [Bacteroidales bacterium]